SGSGSLRDAVTKVNVANQDENDDSDSITFALGSGQTIVLLSPLEDLTEGTVVFDATGTSGLAIDGSNLVFLANDTGSTTIQFKNLSYENGTIDLRSGTSFTLDESASGVIDNMNGDDITLIKTGAGTTTLPDGSTVDLKTGSSNSSDVRIEKGVFVVNGILHTATVLVLPDGTLTVNGTGTVDELKSFESQGTTIVDGELASTSVVVTKGTFTVADGAAVTATPFQSGGTTTIDGTLNAGTTTSGTPPTTTTLALNTLIVNASSAFTIGETGDVLTKEVVAKGAFVVDGNLAA